MAKQKFINQFNMLMEYIREHKMEKSESMFWITLLYMANKKGKYDPISREYAWPDGFISISNSEFSAYGHFDKRAVENARKSLKERGVIDYRKGDRRKRDPSYRLNYLQQVGCEIVPGIKPDLFFEQSNGLSEASIGGTVGNENAPNHVPKTRPIGGTVGNENAPNHVPKNDEKSSVYAGSEDTRYRYRYKNNIDVDVEEQQQGLVDLSQGIGPVQGLVDLSKDYGLPEMLSKI